MGFILCTSRTRTVGESPRSDPTAAGGRNTWGPHKACFVGRGEAKAQVEFSACGKCNIVTCALTKRVAAVDKIEEKRKPDDFVGHRNRTPAPEKARDCVLFQLYSPCGELYWLRQLYLLRK